MVFFGCDAQPFGYSQIQIDSGWSFAEQLQIRLPGFMITRYTWSEGKHEALRESLGRCVLVSFVRWNFWSFSTLVSIPTMTLIPFCTQLSHCNYR